jgi:Flp pilus assembly protein TadD
VGTGPKGFLLQQAVTRAQRALLQGDTAGAHAAFCSAAQLGVPSDKLLLGLTQVLLMQAQLTAALKTVDQLLERAPTNKQALDWRGDILIRMGRVDEAREAWFKAAGATRASQRLIDNLLRTSDADAKTALRSGDLSRADRMLRRAIALTSGDPERCRELAAVLTKSGQRAAAERWRGYLSSLGG